MVRRLMVMRVDQAPDEDALRLSCEPPEQKRRSEDGHHRLTMDCPHCGSPMTADRFDTRDGKTVSVDYCCPCQFFWFDAHESLQLSPAATLKLFTIVGTQASQPRPAPLNGARCPRCRSPLALTHDMQRATRFQYWRCEEHGRLIGFYDFLREKDFIRPLSPAQLAALRQNVGEINCSNCGAPIDPAVNVSCPHCGTPLSMLDMEHAGQLIAELRHAADSTPPTGAGAPGATAAVPPVGTGSKDPVSDGLSALLARLSNAK
jgi:hypothetical protein